MLTFRPLSPSSGLDARHFSSSLYSTGASQAATPVLELRRSLIQSMCGFFRRNCLGLQKFLPVTQSPLGFAARSYGDLSSWHWNPGLGGLVWGWDSLLSRYPSRIFIHHMRMWDKNTSHILGWSLQRASQGASPGVRSAPLPANRLLRAGRGPSRLRPPGVHPLSSSKTAHSFLRQSSGSATFSHYI